MTRHMLVSSFRHAVCTAMSAQRFTALLFVKLRLQTGHFSAERHFGFEGAAWYWHFVDVVWLGLYVLVYWM